MYYVYIYQIRDTLKFVLEAYKKMYGGDDQKAKESNTNAMEYLTGSKSSISGKLEDFEPVKQRTFRIVNYDDTLLKLASVFALGSHVVGVVKDKILVGVINQGQCFKEVTARLYDSKKFKSKLVNNCSLLKLKELNYVSTIKDPIPVTMKAIDAFEMMNKHGLSGLCVVNQNGGIAHNTSATDIKLWLQKGDQSLQVTIEKFIIDIRNQSFGDDRFPYCALKYTDSLQRAIGKLKATGYGQNDNI